MTEPMKQALERRRIVWGARNAEVLRELRKEVRSPVSSFNKWLNGRGLQWYYTGYKVQIGGAP